MRYFAFPIGAVAIVAGILTFGYAVPPTGAQPSPPPGVRQSGAITNGHCTQWAGTNLVSDAGGACGIAGGVSQLIAGTNITLSPPGGTGTVTVSTTAGATVTKRTLFAASGTFTKDPTATLILARCVGGGGAAGAGAKVNSGSAASGAGGGSPGDMKATPWMLAAGVTSPVAVTIGAVATPGASQTVANTAGANGGNGGTAAIVFTPQTLTCFGGGGGQGGQLAAGSSGGSGPSDIASGNVAGSATTGSLPLFNGLGTVASSAGQPPVSTSLYGNPSGAGGSSGALSNAGGNGLFKHASCGSGGGVSATAGGVGGAGGGNTWNTTGATGGTAGGTSNPGGNGNNASLSNDPTAIGSNGASGGGGSFASTGGTGGGAPAGGYGMCSGGGGSSVGNSGAGGTPGGPAVEVLEILGANDNDPAWQGSAVA